MTMGPPEKRVKRTTPLETKLETLKRTLTSLQPIWECYDPGNFMEQMYHTRDQLGALTPDTVEEFISNGECTAVLDVLDLLDRSLGKTSSMGPQPPGRSDLYQKVRNSMIAYVQDVQESLNGQS